MFDLRIQLKRWSSQLKKSESFKTGDIEELEDLVRNQEGICSLFDIRVQLVYRVDVVMGSVPYDLFQADLVLAGFPTVHNCSISSSEPPRHENIYIIPWISRRPR